jgi:hypothetical protein
VNPFPSELVRTLDWSNINAVVAHVEVLVMATNESFVGGVIKSEMLMYLFDLV